MMPRPNSDVSFDFPEILDLETNHNSFWVCHLHLFFFFSKTFSKQLYINICIYIYICLQKGIKMSDKQLYHLQLVFFR